MAVSKTKKQPKSKPVKLKKGQFRAGDYLNPQPADPVFDEAGPAGAEDMARQFAYEKSFQHGPHGVWDHRDGIVVVYIDGKPFIPEAQ